MLRSRFVSTTQGRARIETDLKITKDGIVFLHHDKELSRTTNGHGLPSDYTWKELQELDGGSWFSPLYAGERLVSLEQFLHYFGRKNILFALELKDQDIELPVLELIGRYGLRKQFTITSFRYENLQAVRAANPTIRIGYLIHKVDADAIERLIAIGAQQICPSAELLTKEDVQLAKAHGLEIRVWRAHTFELMSHTLACGVDGMTVNFPDKLAEALHASHAQLS